MFPRRTKATPSDRLAYVGPPNDANPCPTAWPDQVELWCVGCLLNRLAALEHERDKANAEADRYCSQWVDEKKRAEHADAALLSLQTAVKQAAEMFWPPQNAREEHLYEIRNGKNREYVEAHVDALIEEAALLPDPAGTTP